MKLTKGEQWDYEDCLRYREELMNKAESGKITQEEYEKRKRKNEEDIYYYEKRLRK